MVNNTTIIKTAKGFNVFTETSDVLLNFNRMALVGSINYNERNNEYLYRQAPFTWLDTITLSKVAVFMIDLDNKRK